MSSAIDNLLPNIVVENTEKPSVSIIWLHGLGANGHDFEPVAHELCANFGDSLGIRFILPHAPSIPVTINNGMVMPAWYDMLSLENPRRLNWDTVKTTHVEIEKFIQSEKEKGVEKVMIAGFSQGGAIAFYSSFGSDVKINGIIALSTYLFPDEDGLEDRIKNKSNIPIFMAHGEYDPVIPYDYAVESKTRLENLGCSISWKEYPMPHSVCPEEINHIFDWIKTNV